MKISESFYFCVVRSLHIICPNWNAIQCFALSAGVWRTIGRRIMSRRSNTIIIPITEIYVNILL